jgi:hypothetical protein
VPTTVHVNTSLPTYVPKGCTPQPLDGGQHGDSLGGSSPRGNPPGGPPFNPHVQSFEWLTPDPRIFIPPWYQPHVVQLVPKPITKLPYKKLQYPTYVKNIDPNVHIKVLKKAIKANGETMEVDIINLFGFTLKDNISKRGENSIQNHPNCTFEKLEQAFWKQFKIVKNDEKVYMQLQNIQQQPLNVLRFTMNAC